MEYKFLSLLLYLLPIYINGDIYRLPTNVKPIHYDITIRLNELTFANNEFTGEVDITLQVSEATSEIKLHSENINITNVNLIRQSQNINVSHVTNDTTNLLTILSNTSISPDNYTLRISYQSTFSPYDMHGFYKSSYRNVEGKSEYLGTTQFEATHARRAFPCFDEPGFKATFNLSVVYPKGYNVLANTPQNGQITEFSNSTEFVNFKLTPVMSTYLNAFIVSKFTCDSVERNSVTFRVCSREEAGDDRKYALEVTPMLVKKLENFTGISYASMGIGNKLDQAAIPDFSAGAMENWGLITYRETSLLWNENESSNFYKQRVASVIAHELTHMWFGNLVTLKWWSDVFLNEGFARYFQYFATSEMEPEWELENQFVVEQVQSALLADSSNESLALSSPVSTPQQVSKRFDSISYNKGASIIRMIASVMGMEKFKQGIQQYLNKHKFNNTIPENLWTALNNFTNITFFRNFTDSWSLKPGYPVLNVRTNGKDVVITQKNFILSENGTTNSSVKWYVPITYTTSRDSNKLYDTNTKVWLESNQSELILEKIINDKSDWIILNNKQIGFYRVNYDKNLWKRIQQVLLHSPNDINVVNRAQIVDDLFNFARADRTSLEEVMDIISFLSEETDYYPWYSAFKGFSYLLLRINDQPIRNKLHNHILQLMDKLYKTVSFTAKNYHDQIYSLKQMLVIQWACDLGKEDCVKNSLQIFTAYKNGTRVNKNLKHTVYCTALRHSNKSEEDWNFLWRKFNETKLVTEQVTILSALGCTKNETLLDRYLNYTIIANDSLIRRQDALLVFTSILSNSDNVGFKVVGQFLKTRYSQLYSYFQDEDKIFLVLAKFVDRMTEQSHLVMLEEFVQSEILANQTRVEEYAKSLLSTVRRNVNVTRRIEHQLQEYFKKDINNSTTINNSATIQTFNIITISFSVFLGLYILLGTKL